MLLLSNQACLWHKGLQQEVLFISVSSCISCISLLAALLLLSHGHDLLDGIQTQMVLAALVPSTPRPQQWIFGENETVILPRFTSGSITCRALFASTNAGKQLRHTHTCLLFGLSYGVIITSSQKEQMLYDIAPPCASTVHYSLAVPKTNQAPCQTSGSPGCLDTHMAVVCWAETNSSDNAPKPAPATAK